VCDIIVYIFCSNFQCAPAVPAQFSIVNMVPRTKALMLMLALYQHLKIKANQHHMAQCKCWVHPTLEKQQLNLEVMVS